MQLDRGSQALLVWTFAMQKATYYDNAGLFGGYSYPKSDSYTYGSTHQGFSSASIENDYQNPICPIQTTSVRPPAHKNGDINGSCMRPSASQGNSQTESISEQQQAAPLAASSPALTATPHKKRNLPAPLAPVLPPQSSPSKSSLGWKRPAKTQSRKTPTAQLQVCVHCFSLWRELIYDCDLFILFTSRLSLFGL